MTKFKIGNGVICIEDSDYCKIGDVVLIANIDHIDNTLLVCSLGNGSCWLKREKFTPCPNEPRQHFNEIIAHALGANIEAYNPNCPVDDWSEITTPKWFDSWKYRIAIPTKPVVNNEAIDELRNDIEMYKDTIGDLERRLELLGG